VQYNGAAILRQPGGASFGLATIMAPNLGQTFRNLNDTFRLTFDMTMLDFGGGSGSYGFGLGDGKSSMSMWAGLQITNRQMFLASRSQLSPALTSTALHLDWQVTKSSASGGIYDAKITAYPINPNWISTPDFYSTQGTPITTLSSKFDGGSSFTLAAFCGDPQLTPTTRTDDRGSVAFDNIYVQAAPEPATAALLLTGALALLARKPRRVKGLD
jgi:hypothetical protein